MNILVNKLPKKFNGINIDTSFKTVILFEILLQDRTIEDTEKWQTAIVLFFDKKTQEKYKNKPERLINTILKLYTGDITTDITKKQKRKKSKFIDEEIEEEEEEKKPVTLLYSFEHDSELIYSAFLQQYNIDLITTQMHWWQFKALFKGLTEPTRFVKVLEYRSIDLNEIKDKDQREFYRKQKAIHSLKNCVIDERTQEEKDEALAKAFWNS